MDNFLSYVQIFLAIVAALGILVAGFFALLGMVDRGKKEQQKEADEIDNRVIKGLKDELTLQGGVISRMEGELKEIRDNNMKLASENKTLREILQGRDEATIKYQAAGLQAMAQVKEMHGNMERLVSAIEKLVANQQTSATPTVSEVHTSITTHPKGE